MKSLRLLIIPAYLLLLVTIIGSKPVLAVSNVLVVINRSSSTSVKIGEYYAKKRAIPSSRICRIDCTKSEDFPIEDYYKLRDAIKSHIKRNGLKDEIDYIVLTKDIPLRIRDGNRRFSVDSCLVALWYDEMTNKSPNPYYESSERFSSKKFGIYLVTRLDGYTEEDVLKLVDRSIAAKPQKGLFLFETPTSWDKKPLYGNVNKSQREAAKLLKQKGFQCKIVSDGFAGGEKGLMGYYTWGSNNSKFDSAKYCGNTFLPGAIAETVVSTSARSMKPQKEGQSLIADLIKSGVTGVKGYCTEPFVTAVARADILFDRYTSGFNLAESFYAASPYIHWMDIIVGDPLCSPYPAK
jgi:uncharacterized protein (TIGR03790 family)